MLQCAHVSDARKKKDMPMKATEEERGLLFRQLVIDTIRRLDGRKVSVSPLGEVHYPND